MKKLLGATFSLVVASSAGFAADLPSKKSAPVAAAACSSSWAVSARGWLTGHKLGEEKNKSVGLGGGSVSYTPDSCSGITYTFTSLYGQTGEWKNRNGYWDKSYRRWDTELFAQIPWGSGFSLNAGVRLVDFVTNTNNKSYGTTYERFNDKVILAELGVGYVASLGKDLSAFANVNYLIGADTQSLRRTGPDVGDRANSGGQHGFDAAVGLAYKFDKNWSSSLRYRYTGLSSTSFYGGMNVLRIQGPELNVSYRF